MSSLLELLPLDASTLLWPLVHVLAFFRSSTSRSRTMKSSAILWSDSIFTSISLFCFKMSIDCDCSTILLQFLKLIKRPALTGRCQEALLGFETTPVGVA